MEPAVESLGGWVMDDEQVLPLTGVRTPDSGAQRRRGKRQGVMPPFTTGALSTVEDVARSARVVT